MNVELVPIDSVTPYARNPRRNEQAVDKVAASLREFSWRQPIVVDESKTIIVGHTRYLAAQKLGYATIPVHVATGLTPAQIKAYRLMDNRSHQDSSWDDELLRLELDDLELVNYDLSLTGFDLAELGDLLYDAPDSVTDEAADFIPEPPAEPVTRLGDVWLLGAHRIVCGDVRDPEVWANLLAFVYTGDKRSVQMCITSPPYWGLRDYGTAQWEGGEAGCEHTSLRRPGPDDKSFTNAGTSRDRPTNTCRLCGARRIDAQLGLEASPEAWTANLVEVFRRVRECLADDGTLWVNCGDSYAGGGPHHGEKNLGKSGSNRGSRTGVDRLGIPGLKPKDLVGQPWRLAFALQADGWWLRQDIIWAKPNPMPESVTDRCTKAHEYLFLLAKAERYYWDAEAVREHVGEPTRRGNHFRDVLYQEGKSHDNSQSRDGQETYHDVEPSLAGRNRRSVWSVATQPTPEAHFATYPCKLIEPCILAGTSARGHCPACGRGWERQIYSKEIKLRPNSDSKRGDNASSNRFVGQPSRGSMAAEKTTTGWQPGCECSMDKEDGVTYRTTAITPALVLDLFLGAGTTMIVAEQTGRACRGIELNPAYIDISIRRFEKLFGVQATLEGDGRTFDAVAGERLEKAA